MKPYEFDAQAVTDEIIDWIKLYFMNNATPYTKAIVGISGGKDSSVVAALCARALGKDRVVGILMPNGYQEDINYSYALCQSLGITYIEINIGLIMKDFENSLEDKLGKLSTVTTFNTPARVRMTTLYAVAGTIGGRVANTCNLSEDYVGYATKFGDAAGDFSPLADLTVQEVKAIGRILGLHEYLVSKTPIDGLCGRTDEDNLGFTYAVLDKWLREGVCDDVLVLDKIMTMHKNGLHKLLPMPTYCSGLDCS